MSAIKLFVLAIQVVRWFQKYFERRGMLKEANDAALRKLGLGAGELIKAALSARAGVSHDPDSVRDDPNNRDAR